MDRLGLSDTWITFKDGSGKKQHNDILVPTAAGGGGGGAISFAQSKYFYLIADRNFITQKKLIKLDHLERNFLVKKAFSKA